MDWSNNVPFIKDKRIATGAGILFLIVGVVCLYDSHEGRGDDPPFWFKFLPGL
jgi:hypothetical protein